MTRIACLVLAFLFVVATATADSNYITWYGRTNVPATEVEQMRLSGCYYGSYGLGEQLTLTTCAAHPEEDAFAVLPEETFLCVLELSTQEGVMEREAPLLADALDPEDTAMVELNQHLIIIHRLNEYSPLCTMDYSKLGGLVRNRIFVPREPIRPEAPMPVNHPALLKTLLAPEGAAQSGPEPKIEDYLNAFSYDGVKEYVRWLSTDKRGTNQNITRNSYAIKTGRAGCVSEKTWRCANTVVDDVVNEVQRLMENYPYHYEIEQLTFREDMCNNVRLIIPGLQSESIVVIGAHLDSRNTASSASATGAAPGADDNGSGSAVNLEIVKSIALNENKHQFYYTLHILWFCGEEQGLLGSSAMAKQYKQEGAEIIAMFNNDMIGYTDPAFGVILSFMNRFATAWLISSCKAIVSVYVPQLKYGDTNACCSDQQSFFNNGFPAAGIFETPTGAVSYPSYHKSSDTWDNGLINYEQIYQFGLANFACILEYAVPLDEIDL